MKLRETAVGRSFYRSPERTTERERAAGHWANFLLHIYPVKIRRRELSIRHSYFLGVISVVLFGSLVVSGIYLMFFYVPSPVSAYGDIQNLQTEVAFGQFIRNVHRWAAHLMVLSVAAHMAQVFYRGAYKPPREFNWVIGVVLLIMTLLLSFTGYLLPWDQLAFWAVTVGTSMADFVPFIGAQVKEILIGGEQVGEATLLRFYVFHVVVLPLLLGLILMVHIWRWRKDTMLEVGHENIASVSEEAGGNGMEPAPGLAEEIDPREPRVALGRRVLGVVPGQPAVGERKDPQEQDLVMVSPHLLVRHGVVALGVLLVVLGLGLLFDAPLRDVANPFETPNPEKAPWYFAALQELLSHFHPAVAGVLVPAAIVIGMLSLAYIDRNEAHAPARRKVAVVVFTTFLVLWIVLTVIGFAFRGPNWDWVWPWEEWHGEL